MKNESLESEMPDSLGKALQGGGNLSPPLLWSSQRLASLRNSSAGK
jgi:hypothetical protein